jgi:hypothetical protein
LKHFLLVPLAALAFVWTVRADEPKSVPARAAHWSFQPLRKPAVPPIGKTKFRARAIAAMRKSIVPMRSFAALS